MAILSLFRRGHHRRPRIGMTRSVRGRAVHLHVTGYGPPVLLLHGNGGLGEEILGAFAHRRGMMWIAPDRPGYGFSAPLQGGRADPQSMARWMLDLLDELDVGAVHVVAHSIAAGLALCAADRAPERILSLTLINPFCRPTPHRWMPGLRMVVAPVIGQWLRPLVPGLLSLVRHRVLARLSRPNPVPPTLAHLPLRHAARATSILSVAKELRSFNRGMARADPRVAPGIPVVALMGRKDTVARPDWHAAWLRARVADLRLTVHDDVGHMLHHVRPDLAWQAVARAIAARPGRNRGTPHDRTEPRPELLPAEMIDRTG